MNEGNDWNHNVEGDAVEGVMDRVGKYKVV